MAFCRQCAQQLADDDLFCTVCGASQGAVGAATGRPGTASNDRLNEVMGVAIGILTRPISTIRAVVGMDFHTIGILGGAIAILTGLLGMWAVSALGNSIMDMIPFASMGSSSWTSDFPWGKVFAYSLVGIIMIMLALFLGLFSIGKLMFKSNSTAIPYLNVAVASTIPTIAAMIIGIIFCYIFAPMGFLVFNMGTMVSIVCIFFGLKEISLGEDDRLAYGLALVFLVYYFVLYLVGKILASM
ncbi:MAG TPA: zinc ribbon domain-containing protein [Syntrophomonadaceae bacterium]|nr:zinc ribbon domain-containing protein [Syntrophomonadaceae bacterium]